MNYYTLPKINNKVNLDPHINSEIIQNYNISQTLINYYNEIIREIQNFYIQNEDYHMSYDEITKIINPYEYIYSKVPSSNYSVSKLKTKSIMFYDLFEIFQTINLLDSFKFDIMNSLIIGANYQDSLECLEMLRENYNIDKFFCFYEYNSKLYNCIEKTKFNFIIYEMNNFKNINQYVISFVELLLIIFNNLKKNGIVVLKIDNMFLKPVIEIIYLLNSIFEKTLIIKPHTSDIMSFDKYIIFQKLAFSQYDIELFKQYNTILTNFMQEYNDFIDTKNENNENGENNKENEMFLKIKKIIHNELPYYFLNKIDDINVIIGQQQLEAANQIINILKSKNMDDKIESMKKNNIQKSVNWCEKFKIPCNKFSDKINIFFQ